MQHKVVLFSYSSNKTNKIFCFNIENIEVIGSYYIFRTVLCSTILFLYQSIAVVFQNSCKYFKNLDQYTTLLYMNLSIVVSRIKPGLSHKLGKHSITELHLQVSLLTFTIMRQGLIKLPRLVLFFMILLPQLPE